MDINFEKSDLEPKELPIGGTKFWILIRPLKLAMVAAPGHLSMSLALDIGYST